MDVVMTPQQIADKMTNSKGDTMTTIHSLIPGFPTLRAAQRNAREFGYVSIGNSVTVYETEDGRFTWRQNDETPANWVRRVCYLNCIRDTWQQYN